MNRSERRRQSKEDHRVIARGLDIEARDGYQIVALMRVLRELIDDARRLQIVAPLMSFLYENMSKAERSAPRDLIACRKGCSHCCNIWVSATAPEILFAKRAMANGALQQIQTAISNAHAVTGPLSFDQRANIAHPCPLLVDNLCQIYNHRPATCRTAASADAAICERSYLRVNGENSPTPAFYIALRQGYAVALAGALKHAGYPTDAYEFNAALQAAITRTDAEMAWLGGADVFAEVQRDPAGDLFTQPLFREFFYAAFT